MSELQQKLAGIRRELEDLKAKMAGGPVLLKQLVFTVEEAAKELATSERAVRRIVNAGFVETVVVLGVRSIPACEIARLRAMRQRAPIGARDPNSKRVAPSKPSRRSRVAMGETRRR